MDDRPRAEAAAAQRPAALLDVVGAGLMVAAAIALMLALSWGGTRYPWPRRRSWDCLPPRVVLWAAFAMRLLHAPEPFVPLDVLREPIIGR